MENRMIDDVVKHFLNINNDISSIYLADKKKIVGSEMLLGNEMFDYRRSIDDVNFYKFQNDIYETGGTYCAIVSFPAIITMSKTGFVSEYQNFHTHLISKALDKIKIDGVGVFVLPSRVFFEDQFFKVLENHRAFINLAISLPRNVFENTSIDYFVLVISRVENDNGTFFTQLSTKLEENIQMIDSFVSMDSKISEYGDFIKDVNGFKYFEFLADRELEYMLKNYQYQRYPLHKLCTEISSIKKNSELSFSESENTLFISRIGVRKAYTEFDSEKMRTGNYYCLKLKKELANSEYMKQFFESEIGQSILKSRMPEATIPSIKIKDLRELEIPMPTIDEQKILLNTQNRLNKLAKAIELYSNEITHKPDNVDRITNVVAEFEEALSIQSRNERVGKLLKRGETDFVEFKEFFKLNKLGIVDKNEPLKCVRAVASFLNSSGGILLVGVNDDGEVKGLENEPFENDDKLVLAFKNVLRDMIGEIVFSYAKYELIEINEKKIISIDCKPSHRPVFVTEKKVDYFYIRANRSTETLKRNEMIDYIQKRFFETNSNIS